jgi:quercetin dioxygenase-like cupin family protein
VLRVGQELTQPLSGERYLVQSTAASSGGALFRVETRFAPTRFRIVEHLHPAQEERFVVLGGRIWLEVDGHGRWVAAGETATVPPGRPHRWLSPEHCSALVEFRPALRAEDLFATVARLAADGHLTRRGMIRNPLLGALFLDEFWPEVRYTGPIAAASPFARAVAPLVRRLGLRLPRTEP